MLGQLKKQMSEVMCLCLKMQCFTEVLYFYVWQLVYINKLICLKEVVKACRLAMAYRQKFYKDVLIDYICYRRWGHNEMDEPAFTQPLMYSKIRSRQSIPDSYAGQIVVGFVFVAHQLQ